MAGEPRPRGSLGTRDEAELLQLADDVGDRLDGQAHPAGNVGALDRPVLPDRLEHDPPVVGPSEFLVRPLEGHHVSNPRPATGRDRIGSFNNANGLYPTTTK